MKEFIILGKTEEQRARSSETISRHFDRGIGAIEGEYFKDEIELDHIEKASTYLNQELSHLGIEHSEEIKPEQVHFLDQATWDRKFPDFPDGLGQAELGAAYISNERIHRHVEDVEASYELQRFAVVLHESIHIQGHNKYINEDDVTHEYRNGYVVHRNKGEEYKMEMFNEAVVDTLTGIIMTQHAEEIKNRFNADITNWDELSKYLHYSDSIVLVSNIVGKVIDNENCDPKSVWDDLTRNHFTGNMMFLRRIEKAYGKGSLKILAMINESNDEDEQQKMMRKYFLIETTDEERKAIADQVLKSR